MRNGLRARANWEITPSLSPSACVCVVTFARSESFLFLDIEIYAGPEGEKSSARHYLYDKQLDQFLDFFICKYMYSTSLQASASFMYILPCLDLPIFDPQPRAPHRLCIILGHRNHQSTKPIPTGFMKSFAI